MFVGKIFSLKNVLSWTRRDIFKILIVSAFPVIIYEVFELKWIAIPWVPIALIGTAVAFLIGFKNNASYDRTWEARKIWGAIVNSSRSWGILVKDFISNLNSKTDLPDKEIKLIHKKLIYRHIAWITALRFQLRQPQKWENLTKNYNVEFRKKYFVNELESELEDELKEFLSPEELNYILTKKNRATQIIASQSSDLKQLRKDGLTDDFRHVELEKMLVDLYTQQGKCERIKNFPFPRQYATINLFFVWLFILLVPFGLLKEFDSIGNGFVWLTIPFSLLVSWVFHTMEKIGEATENPFEGGANDIPMTALNRTIEIDLKDMLNEENLPENLLDENNILM